MSSTEHLTPPPKGHITITTERGGSGRIVVKTRHRLTAETWAAIEAARDAMGIKELDLRLVVRPTADQVVQAALITLGHWKHVDTVFKISTIASRPQSNAGERLPGVNAVFLAGSHIDTSEGATP